MLKRRKKDWFPVVATDLFCGVLAAVIILDATAPKEVQAASYSVFLSMRFPAPPVGSCQNNSRVIVSFESGHRVFSSVDDAVPLQSPKDNLCVVKFLLHGTGKLPSTNAMKILVARFPGNPPWVELTALGAPPTRFFCGKSAAECEAKNPS